MPLTSMFIHVNLLGDRVVLLNIVRSVSRLRRLPHSDCNFQQVRAQGQTCILRACQIHLKTNLVSHP